MKGISKNAYGGGGGVVKGKMPKVYPALMGFFLSPMPVCPVANLYLVIFITNLYSIRNVVQC